MKRTLALLIGMMISASVARGGDVKVKAVMTAGPKDKPTVTFTTDTPKLLVKFTTKGAKKGDKLRGVWIADDVGDAAPAKTKIDEKTLTLEGDTDDGDFSCTKPTKGWPAGKYHVDIYANDELATTVKFTIEAMEKAEKRDAAEKAEKAAQKTDESEESERGGYGLEARNVAMALVWEKCALSLREIGQMFGGIDYAAIAQRIRRINKANPAGLKKARREMSNV